RLITLAQTPLDAAKQPVQIPQESRIARAAGKVEIPDHLLEESQVLGIGLEFNAAHPNEAVVLGTRAVEADGRRRRVPERLRGRFSPPKFPPESLLPLVRRSFNLRDGPEDGLAGEFCRRTWMQATLGLGTIDPRHPGDEPRRMSLRNTDVAM